MARIILILCSLIMLFPTSVRAGQTVIGVIPFENLSKDDQSIAWFEDGAAKAIVVECAKNPNIKIVDKDRIGQARVQVSAESLSPETVRSIGRLVGASYMVFGEFQKFGDQLKVSAHIVKVSTGTIVNSATATGKVVEIFALQDRIAQATAGNLKNFVPAAPRRVTPPAPVLPDRPLALATPPPRAKPTPKPSRRSEEDLATERLTRRSTSVESENEATRRLMQEKTGGSQSALEWYNKGVALNDNSDQEIDCYNRAIRADPTFPKPYYNLGTIYYSRGAKAEAADAFKKYLQYSTDEEERAKVQQFLGQIGDVGPAPSATVGEKEKKAALELYNKGVELNDDSAEEIGFYRQALSYDPYLGKAYYNLGLIYYRKNMKQEALSNLKKYQEYSTDPPEEKEKIRSIIEYLEQSVSPPPPPETPPPSETPAGVREEPLPD